MARIPKTERILNLIAFLLKPRVPVPWSDIKGNVIGYDDDADAASLERRFERDKEFLRSLGVPVEYVPPDEFGRSGYIIEKQAYFLPRIDITPEDAAVLSLARQLMPEGVSPLSDSLDSALRKIRFDAPAVPDFAATLEEMRLVEHKKALAANEERTNVGTLVQAILDNKRVKFDYYTISRDKTSSREVEPYGLGFTRGAWYLVGHCLKRGEVRVFKVGRIKGRVRFSSPDGEGPDFVLPEDFNLSDYVGLPPWKLRAAKPLMVKVRFDDTVGWMAAEDLSERSPAGTFSVEKTTMTLHVTDVDAFVRWVLGFGTHAVVVSPASVRWRVIEEIQAVKALYSRARRPRKKDAARQAD